MAPGAAGPLTGNMVVAFTGGATATNVCRAILAQNIVGEFFKLGVSDSDICNSGDQLLDTVLREAFAAVLPGAANAASGVDASSTGSTNGATGTTTAAPTVPVTLTGKPLDDEPKEILTEILQQTGLTSANVTSTSRDASGQAKAMYDYIQANGLGNEADTGTTTAYGLYGNVGDQVLDVYADESAKTPKPSEAAILQAMTNKINELGPSNVSHHCSNDYYVFDVGRASIPEDKVSDFVAKAKAHAQVDKDRVYEEPGCIHIEVKKSNLEG